MKTTKILLSVVSAVFFGVSALAFAGREAMAEEKLWKQEIAVGYDQKTGNTENVKLSGTYQGKRAAEESEIDLRAGTLYSSQSRKMDDQKHTGSARYAPNLGQSPWFVFGKFEAAHDKFANIDYRLLPSLGIGYWFIRETERTLSGDLGLGYEFTKYYDYDDEQVVLMPRGYFETTVFTKSKFSEEIILYPGVNDIKVFRAVSETRLSTAVTDQVSLRLSFLYEYNSEPAAGVKKTDTHTILALVYKF